MLQLCYSYVTAINRPFSIWALFFVFTSSLFTVACSEEPQAPDLKLDAPSKSAEIRDRAAQAWDSIRMEHADLFIEKDGHVLLRNEFTESNQATDDICQCGVEIISVDLVTPPSLLYGDFELYSPAACSATNPGLCNYFSSRYSVFEECASSTNPECTEVLSPPFSGSVWSFNCDLPAFTVIPIVFGGFAFSENCGVADFAPFDSAVIKFKVHCVGKDYSDIACTRHTGAVTIYSSDEITMSLPSPMSEYETNPRLDLALSGCGCQPDYFELF